MDPQTAILTPYTNLVIYRNFLSEKGLFQTTAVSKRDQSLFSDEIVHLSGSGEIACSELSPESKSSSSSVTADSPTLPSIKWPSRQLSRRHSRYSRTQPTPPAHPQQGILTHFIYIISFLQQTGWVIKDLFPYLIQ